MVAAVSEDPTVVQIAREFLGGRYDAAVGLVNAAIPHGQIRPDIDPLLVWQAVVNPPHLRAVLGEPADDSTAEHLLDLDLVLDGAMANSELGEALR